MTRRFGRAAKRGGVVLIALLLLIAFFPHGLSGTQREGPLPETRAVSDHFDGERFFNPWDEPAPEGQAPRRSSWFWRWLIGEDMPAWPEAVAVTPAEPPPRRVPAGTLRVTAVGHATFLVQMDGLNVLIDPIWSERCSPVSWAGPRRRQAPGLRFADLPPIDLVLVTHNHYDHLDLPTLERLAAGGAPRALTPLGNGELLRGAGMPAVEEMDWWESRCLTPEVTVTLVPARHFSSRTLWDRNKALWGGFVLSGPAGNVYHAGDTAYGPHFRQIAARLGPIRLAILPIAPYRPRPPEGEPAPAPSRVHMGPVEAVQAHRDLGAQKSLASHFQVFQLGWEGFDDAVRDLTAAQEGISPEERPFVAPAPGRFFTFERGAYAGAFPREAS
jgi:L-ascorbate metabolism protein UlaG (beta-lactamase superfamily)